MPPAPVAIVTDTESHAKTNRWPLAVALACVLAAIIAVYFMYPQKDAGPIMRFMSGTFENRTLQELSASGQSTITLPVSGKVLEYARTSVEAAIVLEENGGQAVHLLTAQPKRISTSVSPKSALALSQDGTYLAYAERQSESMGETVGEFYSAEAWVVHVYNTVNTEGQILGVGYAPQFFMLAGEQYVSYTTPFGLRFVNLATNTASDLSVQFPQTDSRAIPTISPDGTYVVLPNVTVSRFSLFKLGLSNGVFSLTPHGELLSNTTSVVFSDGKLYGASRNDTETFFYVADPVDLTSAVEVGRIPLSTVYALIP